jgi:hypothetical protein
MDASVELEEERQKRVDLEAKLESYRELAEQNREKAEQSNRTLRNQGIERLLESRATIERSGKRYAIPKAHTDAAQVILGALADTESDVVELSANGSATLKDTDLGKAVSQLLSPVELIELGESGAADVSGTPDDPEEQIELAIQAKRKETPTLSYSEAFDIVLSEGVI